MIQFLSFEHSVWSPWVLSWWQTMYQWSSLLTIVDQWSSLSTIVDHCWLMIITLDRCWSVIITVDYCWSMIITVDHCWPLLINDHHTWPLLINDHHCWPLSKHGWDLWLCLWNQQPAIFLRPPETSFWIFFFCSTWNINRQLQINYSRYPTHQN